MYSCTLRDALVDERLKGTEVAHREEMYSKKSYYLRVWSTIIRCDAEKHVIFCLLCHFYETVEISFILEDTRIYKLIFIFAFASLCVLRD